MKRTVRRYLAGAESRVAQRQMERISDLERRRKRRLERQPSRIRQVQHGPADLVAQSVGVSPSHPPRTAPLTRLARNLAAIAPDLVPPGPGSYRALMSTSDLGSLGGAS